MQYVSKHKEMKYRVNYNIGETPNSQQNNNAGGKWNIITFYIDYGSSYSSNEDQIIEHNYSYHI